MNTRKTYFSRLKISAFAILMLPIVFIWNPTPAAAQIDPQVVEYEVTVVGITLGQTARINVLNTTTNGFPPGPCRVELAFEYTSGKPVVDRSGRPYDVIVTLDPGHGAFLDVNGDDIIPFPGLRFSLTPCVKILDISGGTLVIPTFEMFGNDSMKTNLLNPGLIRGFNPQPEPPGDDVELEYGLVGVTTGQTAHISVFNGPDPDSVFPPGPCVVAMEYHDMNGNPVLDRSGSPVQKIVTLEPGRGESLLWNFSTGERGSRVSVIPCVKVLRGSPGTRLVRSFQIYDNDTKKSNVLSYWSR